MHKKEHFGVKKSVRESISYCLYMEVWPDQADDAQASSFRHYPR